MAGRAHKSGDGAAAGKAAAAGNGPAAAPAELEQQIRELAYGYYVERGCAEGHDLDDWLRAEAQVQQRNGGAAVGRSGAAR